MQSWQLAKFWIFELTSLFWYWNSRIKLSRGKTSDCFWGIYTLSSKGIFKLYISSWKEQKHWHNSLTRKRFESIFSFLKLTWWRQTLRTNCRKHLVITLSLWCTFDGILRPIINVRQILHHYRLSLAFWFEIYRNW